MEMLAKALEKDITFRDLGVILFIVSKGACGASRNEILEATCDGKVGLNDALKRLAKRGILIANKVRKDGRFYETRYVLPEYMEECNDG